MASSPSTRTKVFIGYSRKDSRYLKQLLEHLAYDERNSQLEIWSDEKIAAGSQWREEIKQAIKATKVAVLLISSSFLASKFIAENELPPLLQAAETEGVVILPVIVRPCNFEDTELADFQTVNRPSNPVSKMRSYQKDELWTKVVQEIKKAVTPPSQEARTTKEQLIKEPPVLGRANVSDTALAALREEMQRQREVDGLFMAGVFDFRQAINVRAWKQAESLLQKYPTLPEARSLLGLGMSQEVQEYFSYQLHPNNPGLGGPVTSLHVLYDYTPQAPPTSEAIRWLEEALKYQDNPEGQVTAALALMYGYSKEYNHMISAIQQALAINPSLVSYFQSPHNLLMLLYACDTLVSIEEVARIVGITLPKREEVHFALRETSDFKKNRNALAKPDLEWYAIELGTRDSSRMPIEVRIIFPNKDGLTYAQISRRGQAPITIPTQPSPSYGSIETLIPVDEILEYLTRSGIILISLIESITST